jgi:iron complex transport system ATP-binding protein
MAIELRGVEFRYRAGETLFEDFRLTVKEQEFFGIIGPNGSGKTTLLRLMAGLLVPDSGEVLVEGKHLSSYARRELARVVGFMPQENHFAFDFLVEEVVMMGRNPFLGRFQRPRREDHEKVSGALQFADCSGLKEKGINAISGGERQRVVLARTLSQEPRILLLDEPTSHLDLAHQLRIVEILKRLNREGVTIIVNLHDLNLASVACSRILLLDKGKTAACGAPAQVLTQELIQQVYGVRPFLEKHPETGTPQVILPARG